MAALLTQHQGEYVFRLGAQPPQAKLFSGEPLEGDDGWVGTPRTDEMIQTLRQGITKLVEEVGGKVIFEI